MSINEHIGRPLEGFVRRLDVALMMLDAIERASHLAPPTR